MLKNHPYYFNTQEMLFPLNWEENWKVVEIVNQSEAGTDIIQTTRIGKLTVKVQYKCTSDWLAIYQSFSKLDTFTLKRWDVIQEDYTEHTVRMRNFTNKLIKKSWDISVSDGLWEVSFELLEV